MSYNDLMYLTMMLATLIISLFVGLLISSGIEWMIDKKYSSSKNKKDI